MSSSIATFPDHAKDRQSLVARADQGLYYAKGHGRNRSVTATELDASSKPRLAAS